MRCWTGETITKLEPNYVFVFGSNPEGRHGSGAAKAALKCQVRGWKRFTGTNLCSCDKESKKGLLRN